MCGRALIFGDKSTTDLYAGDPGVQVHGPGFSKILIGEDEIENWRDFLDVMVSSISDNGGRSCVNASAVIVPKYGREIADALGERLGPMSPLPVDDPNAVLSGFANPKMGEWINSTLEADLEEKGAYDATAPFRHGSRGRGRHLPSPHHRTLRLHGTCLGKSRISLPLCECRGSTPGRDASLHWTDISRDCDYERRVF